MPITKNARKRHNIIDGLMRSHRGYTIPEITYRVNEQLEQDGDSKVSERMIYLDIRNMQEQYPVTIVKRNGRLMYQNREESIENRPLSDEDKKLLEMAVQTFSVFKGSVLFNKFNDASWKSLFDVVGKLYLIANFNRLSFGKFNALLRPVGVFSTPPL